MIASLSSSGTFPAVEFVEFLFPVVDPRTERVFERSFRIVCSLDFLEEISSPKKP